MRTNHFIIGLVLILICLMTQASYGQRHRKGQYGFSGLSGIMDRIPRGGLLQANQQGFLARAEFVRYTESEHYWKAGSSTIANTTVLVVRRSSVNAIPSVSTTHPFRSMTTAVRFTSLPLLACSPDWSSSIRTTAI